MKKRYYSAPEVVYENRIIEKIGFDKKQSRILGGIEQEFFHAV